MPAIFVWRIRLALAALAFALAQANIGREEATLAAPAPVDAVPVERATPVEPAPAVTQEAGSSPPATLPPPAPSADLPPLAIGLQDTPRVQVNFEPLPPVRSNHVRPAVRAVKHASRPAPAPKRHATTKAPRRAQLVSARPPAEEWPFPPGNS
jgi:hypothetical protein